MSFGGAGVDREERFGPVARFAFRLGGSASAAVVVVTLGMFGMLFMRAPAWLSLICEPFSLLLLPGLLISAFRDLDTGIRPHQVVEDACVFYFVVIWVITESKARLGRG